MTATELELRQAWLALLVAECAGDQDSCAVILRRDDDPDFAFLVAVYSARFFAQVASPADLEELRAMTSAELFRLAEMDGVEPR